MDTSFKKPKGYLEECWIVKYVLNKQIKFFYKQTNWVIFKQIKKQIKKECATFIFDPLVTLLN